MFPLIIIFELVPNHGINSTPTCKMKIILIYRDLTLSCLLSPVKNYKLQGVNNF